MEHLLHTSRLRLIELSQSDYTNQNDIFQFAFANEGFRLDSLPSSNFRF